MKRRKVLKFTLYLFGIFLFQEIIIRACFPLPEIMNFDRSNYQQINSKQRTTDYLRHTPWYWESSVDTTTSFVHEMNEYGFRDATWSITKEKNKKRILFIGDSFVEGVMAQQHETITAHLNKLDTQNSFEFMNAGMLGMGISSYLQLLADVVPIYKPDVVFICIYANDLGQTTPQMPTHHLTPEYYNAYKPRIIEVLKQVKANGPVPFKWTQPKPYLPAVPKTSNPWTKNEQELKLHTTPKLANAMKSGTFNPHRTNGFLKEEHFLQLPPKLGQTFPFIEFIKKEYHVKPIVVYIPSRNQITNHYYKFEEALAKQYFSNTFDLTQPQYQIHQKQLAILCEKHQLPFIDLSLILKKEEASGNHLYWNYDEHMRSKGYQVIAKQLFKNLKSTEN